MVILRARLTTQTYLHIDDEPRHRHEMILGMNLCKGMTIVPDRVFRRGRHTYVVFTVDGNRYEAFGPHLEHAR